MPIQLTASQRKIIQFALFGAAGCFAASIIGELWLSATFQKPEVEKQPVAVCLLLDCSVSMQQGGKFKAVKDAAAATDAESGSAENAAEETTKT